VIWLADTVGILVARLQLTGKSTQKYPTYWGTSLQHRCYGYREICHHCCSWLCQTQTQCNQHHGGEWDHFLDQILHSEQPLHLSKEQHLRQCWMLAHTWSHWYWCKCSTTHLVERIQALYRPQWHRCCPNLHHTRCQTLHPCKFLLSLPTQSHLPPVEVHHPRSSHSLTRNTHNSYNLCFMFTKCL